MVILDFTALPSLGKGGYKLFAKAAPEGRSLWSRIIGLFGRKTSTSAAKTLLRPGEMRIGIALADGTLITTSDFALSHADYVRRTLGQLPEGARVFSFGKTSSGQFVAINSRGIHGNQLPVPQWVLDLLISKFY